MSYDFALPGSIICACLQPASNSHREPCFLVLYSWRQPRAPSQTSCCCCRSDGDGIRRFAEVFLFPALSLQWLSLCSPTSSTTFSEGPSLFSQSLLHIGSTAIRREPRCCLCLEEFAQFPGMATKYRAIRALSRSQFIVILWTTCLSFVHASSGRL